MPKRKSRENQLFQIRGKNVVRIEDLSFALFTNIVLDKNEVKFEDVHVDGKYYNDQCEENKLQEEDEMKFCLVMTGNKDPSMFKKAMASPEAQHWKRVIKRNYGR